MKRSTLLFSFLLACNGTSEAPSSTSPALATLDVHVMSQCPYGVKIEEALVPVREKLGGSVDLNFEYIGKGEAGSLESMHGPNEVKGDMVQVCASQQMGEDVLDFIACQNKEPRKVAENWKDCASELKLDVDELTACVEGDEGQKLLAASFKRSADKKATGSPTVFLNGERYTGGRSASQLTRALCGAMGDKAPQVCSELPEPPRIDAVFLSDSRCPECDLHKVEGKLKGDLVGAQVRYLDYSTPEGKAFYDELHATDESFVYLPAILLDGNVEKDEDAYPKMKRFLRKVGSWHELQMGGKFDPNAEICDNEIDDDANGQVDCADSYCAQQLMCREKEPGKLDLYVMSQCPYGAKAILAADKVMEEFGGDIDLDLHFIGKGDASSLSSMHGQAEVDHDIREICAQAKAPGKSLDFAACISRDYKKVDWKVCAEETGISAGTIERCFEGEGKELLAKSFAGAQQIGFSSSPTFLVNNTRKFNAIDPGKLQAEICKDNPGLSGCKATIAADASASAPVPSGECK